MEWRRRWMRRGWHLVVLPVLFAAPLVLATGPTLEPPPLPLEAGAGALPAGLPAAEPAAADLAQPAPVPAAEPSSDTAPVLLAAGDIAACTPGSEATAALLDRLSGTIVTLGDNAYPSGSAEEFARCYAPTWGRHKARTRPVPGNHEYRTPGAWAYFAYFGSAAGEAGRGYYSYDLGTWHMVALNSNCDEVGGCHAGSPQERWLRADLAAHPAACTLAYMHHPRFGSGQHGNNALVEPLWQALYEAGVDVVLAGHEHLYERFAPQDPRGVADPVWGIRQFTVGTGGASRYSVKLVRPNSEVRNDDTYGILKLTLAPDSYQWEFVPAEGKPFTDTGRASCHGAPPLASP